MNISWTNPSIKVGDANDKGRGVFAKEHIEKGERIAVFGGYVVAIEDLSNLQKRTKDVYETIVETGYQVADDLVFSPTHKEQFSVIEYLNHSCDANCGFKGQLELVAMRDIGQEEEITMDYAMCITSDLFALEKCSCDTMDCRGAVSGNDWMNPKLQKKYKGYFQPYIEDKIKKLTKE